MAQFQIEKRYYSASDFNGPLLTDHWPVLYSSLADATAAYERGVSGTDPWWTDEDKGASFAISEIERSGLEIGFHPLPAPKTAAEQAA